MLEKWLAAPLDDVTSSEDRTALEAVTAGTEDARLVKKALARLVEKRRHLVWRAALRFSDELGAVLLDVCKKSKTIEARFYLKTAPGGLSTLEAIHRASSNHDVAQRLVRVPEARLLGKAAVSLIGERSFQKLLGDDFETDEQGAAGMIAVAMLADQLPLADAIVTKRLAQLTGMATELGAKKVLARLAKLHGASDSESARWAKQLGLAADGPNWEVEVTLAARGQSGTYAPFFKISVGGSEGEDWGVRAGHADQGTSVCFAGELLSNPSKLGAIKSLADVPIWIGKTQKVYDVEWVLEKPRLKITGAPTAWKTKIQAWVKTLGAAAR